MGSDSERLKKREILNAHVSITLEGGEGAQVNGVELLHALLVPSSTPRNGAGHAFDPASPPTLLRLAVVGAATLSARVARASNPPIGSGTCRPDYERHGPHRG